MERDIMFTNLVIFMIGSTVGFFTAALCKASGNADRHIENMEK